jgi:hypothetical protein
LSATILKDASPEGERKLDGHLRVLGLRAGNGLWAWNIPEGVTNAVEDASSKPNELAEKFRISAKR